MKKLADVLVIRKENDESLAQRREEYALKRDLQAREQNEAISRRLLTGKASKDGEPGSSDQPPTP